MEKYEHLAIVGEGSYGLVMKCRHRETDQIVAIKKFLETEEDATIRKMALREIRMLKRLKHENLVAMIEVFRHKKRFHLVFEYLEGTVLDELDKMPGGLGEERCRQRIFQVTRGINYCHSNHIVHRDVKPENVLVSSLGVVKLCDFGFARLISSTGEACTEYVATRWYRAPELLVAEPHYGTPIDIWSIGCLFAEMMTGDPLFPGNSDIDQFYLIVKMMGKPCSRHQHLLSKNSKLRTSVKFPTEESIGLYKHFESWPTLTIEFLESCMKMDPQQRLTADELLKHSFFTHDMFPQRFLPALREKVNVELNNPLLRKYKTEILMSTDKRDEVRRKPSRDSKWRFSLTEGTMKRKLSNGDGTVNENFNDKNLITLAETAQRLNVLQQRPSQGVLISKDRGAKISHSSNNASEIQMLEKSLESLAKFSSRQEQQKDELSDSPQFQNLDYGDFNRSPQSHLILHPTINNISFNKDPPKKSPNVLQSINNLTTKPTQVPLLTNPRTQFLKKLERNAVVDNIFATGDHSNPYDNTPIWYNSFTSSLLKKKEVKTKPDDFVLPNLPGATNSLLRSKKRTSPEKSLPLSNDITAGDKARVKRKRKYFDICLPCIFKDHGNPIY
ncbi:cyclin-dependent kinase-like 2 isoform X1 [Diabrotica virgifera virgifera]|uniref:cyclin-dependent kinase n=1 Tax=Diabrotica virgifera virgifera TaxID=50390 RepID=A0A6P7GKA3_DIAVI|nr:cyclin-dependent kinase-like 2 isoform X1 [Diabrotica virgifera virgifera]XP_028144210.1 cyclin-dependent kinase-like 2 isoform X1 [Diabrotica virgifera virgifera]